MNIKKKWLVLTVLMFIGYNLRPADDVSLELKLFEAISSHDAGQAQRLLDDGADPNIKIYNRTLLSVAVQIENYMIAQMLLSKGANPNIQGIIDGRTVLHMAVSKKNYALSYLLLSKNANPNIQDDTKLTPIQIARKNNYRDIEKILLRFQTSSNLFPSRFF